MKVNKNSLIFEVFGEKFRKHHLDSVKVDISRLENVPTTGEKFFDKDGKVIEFIDKNGQVVNNEYLKYLKCLCDIKKFLYGNDFNNRRNLILTKKTYDNLKSYKVPKDIRFEVLATLPNRCDAIQLNENLCMFYWKKDNEICVRFHMLHEHDRINYLINSFCFGINLELKSFFYDMTGHDRNGIRTNFLSDSEFIEKHYSLFMVCITYLELTDVTFDICYSNSKRGHIMKGTDLNNELPYDIIQVNTNWNITKLHIGNSFEVKGHWRLQPYIDGYKYIFINTYNKTGIIKKKAGKEIHN